MDTWTAQLSRGGVAAVIAGLVLSATTAWAGAPAAPDQAPTPPSGAPAASGPAPQHGALLPAAGTFAPRFSLAVLAPGPAAAPAPTGAPKPPTGGTPPRFSTADLVGPRAIKPARALLVVFSASWCGPCKRELPELVKLVRPLAARGVSAVVVVVDREPQGVEAMRRLLHDELRVPFPVVLDRFGIVARRYHAANLPKSVVLDGQGRVVAVHEGYQAGTVAQLAGQLEALAAPLAPEDRAHKRKRNGKRRRKGKRAHAGRRSP